MSFRIPKIKKLNRTIPRKEKAKNSNKKTLLSPNKKNIEHYVVILFEDYNFKQIK